MLQRQRMRPIQPTTYLPCHHILTYWSDWSFACAVASPDTLNTPDFPDVLPLGTPSLLGPDLQPAKAQKPGVYCRRAHTAEQAQAQLAQISGGARQGCPRLLQCRDCS